MPDSKNTGGSDPKPGSREHLDQHLKTRGDGTRRSTDPVTPPRTEQRGRSTRGR